MSNDNSDQRLKSKIKKILFNAGFKKIGTHVEFITDGSTHNFSIDICTIFGDHLILIEGKKKVNLSSSKFNKDIDHAIQNCDKIINNRIIKIKSSDLGGLTINDIKNVQETHYGFVIEETENQDEKLSNKLEKNEMAFWNQHAINHFYNSTKVLGSTSKYEILREFSIKIPPKEFHAEKIVKIKQDNHELFLLGMHPSMLLKMGYVYRRISTRQSSYQRVIEKNRLPLIKKFYTENKNLMLANSVLIAFDGDDYIQNLLESLNKKNDGKLHFPTSYCSAWIIDGQHRVYGFKDTKYAKAPKKYDENTFRLPVVAFKKLPEETQSRTFVDINYYQKRINTILIYDLVSSYPNLKYELTWACLLVKKLSKQEPWINKIQTTQNDPKRPITITGFVRPVLFEKLLGYDAKRTKDRFQGPLFKAYPFFEKKQVINLDNQDALKKQLSILTRFFHGVKNNAGRQWENDKKYGLTRFPGVNALLLTLTSILKKYKKGGVNFDDYLATIGSVTLTRKRIGKIPRGYSAMNKLHEEMLDAINAHNNDNLQITKL